MDVLKTLFEQHFHSPVVQVKPLHGELGGSGRSIVRLSGETDVAIGVLHSVREENVAFIEFSRHFRRHHLPVPEIYAEDLDQGAYLEEDLGDTTLFEFLSQNRDGSSISPAVDGRLSIKWWSCFARFQVEARARSELQKVLSARQFRPAIHCLGPELLQILFPQACRHSLQRTGTGR